MTDRIDLNALIEHAAKLKAETDKWTDRERYFAYAQPRPEGERSSNKQAADSDSSRREQMSGG